MGHKCITTTMRYAHLADGIKKEAVNVLNGLSKKTDDKEMSENVRKREISQFPIL